MGNKSCYQNHSDTHIKGLTDTY